MFFELDPVIRETARTEKNNNTILYIRTIILSTNIKFKLFFQQNIL